MDAVLSSAASELISRLVSYLIRKYQNRRATDNTAIRLQQTLLRARVVVEEAEGRQISNRAMLEQLNQLKRELYRAAYAIDAFMWRDRRSHAKLSRYRSHTRPPLSSDCSDLLPTMVGSLEAALSDMREFVVLLSGCPRVTRQPYSTYLFMESCMFGRQMEKEEIISFLSRPSQDLDVLPIIGPLGVGKRTLMEHVCLDERVRERFTKIHRLASDELDDLQNPDHHWSLFDNFSTKSLMVIDMVGSNTDAEESWRRFHSAVFQQAHRGSKILIISRMEGHSSLGTIPVLRLHMPQREELWYFFRVLAFGAADPNERPDLLRIAMALFKGTSSDFAVLFAAANTIAAALRADLSSRSWCRLLKVFSEATMLQAGHYYISLPVKGAPGSSCLFYNGRKLTSMALNDLPKVTMSGLLTSGSPLPTGETRFDVLVWQSRIPPYASYIATCDIDETHPKTVALKKRLLNKRRRDHQEDGTSN
ncbi:hypothetical protein PR202_gn00751 [Eleusine coracana subsp. coracana]|uniref:Disease resistance N-terminal domain-containing protein n=1 Tax=Eleusine coracana subsp. coracana TaxID=191504 RepID=A0AAV5G0G0_ELECO|nr:hypothetical protein QOZ80_1BG0053700 [Eleusine coracana subsp. coracana]GJN41383.1 hypothetical protein PR202_gn00751 [Eleusine coracana subsp. coracana]